MQWLRQEEIVSKDGQQLLASQRIALIGTGGIGSHFALIGAFVGLRDFMLIDPDTNQQLNRNRSAREADVGRPKVDCLKEQIKAIDSGIAVTTYTCAIQEVAETLQLATVIVSCPDNWQARVLANQRAVENSKILVDMGFGYANGRMGCHAALYASGGACLRCGVLQEGAAPPSNASFLPTMLIAASLGMELLVAQLTNHDRAGEERPNFLFYDAIERTMVALRRIPRASCPVCSRATARMGGAV